MLRAKGLEVLLIDEESLHLHRNEAYRDGHAEKNTRGLLKATTDRSLTKWRFVVLDSLNNIKGYRYELWCVARQAATRYCVVHVDTPAETCRQWNSTREAPVQYEERLLDDLCGRFERPDSRNRWDAPLFTVHPLLGQDHIQRQLEAVVLALTDEAAGGPVSRMQQGPVAKQLVPNIATDCGPGAAATNTLFEVDRATQAIVDQLAAAQAAAGVAPVGVAAFDEEGLQPLQLQRPVTLPELRRHKRAFMKLATNLTFNRVHDAATARRLFVGYLREQLAQ
ncbi:hypothetical protein N2152v2_004606 [Parachlorella kessleri]